MPRRRLLLLITTVLLGLVVPLAGGPTTPRPAPAAAAATMPGPVQHVVAVSVDGLNPNALTRLGPSRAPTFHRLMREGAFTLNARTAHEATITLPNHTTMLTGRRIDARKGGHGLSINVDPGGNLHRRLGSYLSSVFDVVHDGGGSTALYTGKDKFRLFKRTWRKKGRGGSKLDTFRYTDDGDALVSRFVADLETAPRNFAFLHLAGPDIAGHASGFMGLRYLDAVARADAHLAQVLDAIESSPSMRGRTALLVAADHGGRKGHLDPTKRANYRIPFFAWGPGVPAGANLYRLNDRFRSPAQRRSTYQRPRQPIRNGLVANLSTKLLGLGPVAGSTIDPRQRFTVTP